MPSDVDQTIMPSEPSATWHVEVWSLYGRLGILCMFGVYTGKSKEPEDVVQPLRERIILRLSLKGDVIYCDNFFSSPALFQKLRTKDIGVYGTVRANICLRTRSHKRVK
jgi:hypothetical protein